MGRWLVVLAVLASTVGVAAVARAQPEKVQQTTAASSTAVPLPEVRFSDRTLTNGLRVLLVEDHSAPTVAINIGYHVGGKDDPPGRSGFAHLFEHLMFKGTANTKPETIDRLTEDVGGQNNAFTAEDLTNYYDVVPSNYLETLLWAEADRLKSLVVDEKNFKAERAVVIGEYDQRILANPYGKLSELIESESYTLHPYERGVIGNPVQLNAASLADVRRFHSTYYRPENATLVVVGDFDPAQANTWIDRYFSSIPKSPKLIPRVIAVEPPQTVERRYTYYGANVPLPAVAFAYHAVADASPDAAALQVLENLLSEGESSRLYRSLVYERQVASGVSADADLREQPGLFIAYAILNAGKTTAEAEQLLQAEIEKLQTEPVGAAELEKAKTQLVSALVRSREESNDRALALVLATIREGSPERVNTAFAELQAVSAADVQRVARMYLMPTNRTVILYLPRRMQPSAKRATPQL